ncbi:PPK2 family polyphosphate--nucleotide phosphotransferase [Pseudoclavibacter sp. RFBJ3]|uniref:PPK2 family polyphosphate kinase n=1 Tax=unclassified Pseudoclavibacter TaxID=2615177 RepID=UPI000CE7A075|nr:MULTISPECIES: PPK2 family polyphosphate kinase [unclassified Pseudoclavibacter]PPF81703.1 PPK2 family polyphosphate--nucleotide phosphotransferase [Pseudoclavibacter sp. RFBJ5]PPF91033.1 PPK2 family polyphosphate--nucleotide phosphotransferase [Pseudoclavibacter sp. RFBJ3]PPG00309.1 PPK2 family polyphosphate--nucleotide phosphotransferase [Pseudoclavibacter sp. RFBH5]PPG20168.1 PPK2 family polyphosphate--nucleotide phosphotransferase [Pseudoclavibacter sp. RFBI4]
MPHFTTEDAAVLRVDENFDLGALDPRSTPGFTGRKADAATLFTEHDDEIAELQERMFANSRAGLEAPSVLLLLQGMDTSGKGGIVRHVIGGVDPQGVQIASFKAPTAEEREQDFLVRVRKQLPAAGKIGVFDRSHYEDVLIQRVRSFAPPEEIERRYGAIVDFENELAASGTKLIKVMLHISKGEQGARLAERLERPDKHWKFNPGDIDERLLWDQYQEAYEIALQRTSTETSPWYCVPADRKWFSRLVVKGLLLDALRGFDLQWPAADFDVEAEKRRLAESA